MNPKNFEDLKTQELRSRQLFNENLSSYPNIICIAQNKIC